MKLLGIEMPFEEFDRLLCEQNKGKGLKVVTKTIDGEKIKKVIAVEHEESEKERLQVELERLKEWFEEYDNQVKQFERCQRLEIEFDRDIEKLDNEAFLKAKRISEIRSLLKIFD